MICLVYPSTISYRKIGLHKKYISYFNTFTDPCKTPEAEFYALLTKANKRNFARKKLKPCSTDICGKSLMIYRPFAVVKVTKIKYCTQKVIEKTFLNCKLSIQLLYLKVDDFPSFPF